MILVEDKLIYIHIPKTGGVSIEDFLLNHYGCKRSIFTLTDGVIPLPINAKNMGWTYYPCMHLPLPSLIKTCSEYNIDNNWKIFSIVRNPYYKFISELFYTTPTGLCYNYHTLPVGQKEMLVNQSIDYYFENLDNINNYHSAHSYPQYKFFENSPINCQIYKFEEGLKNVMVKLGYEVKDFPHRMNIFKERRVPKPDYREVLTPYLVETINNRYAKDFEIFGYEMLDPLDI